MDKQWYLTICLVQKNTRVKIRKLEISFAPRCHWTRRNLPVRGTCT